MQYYTYMMYHVNRDDSITATGEIIKCPYDPETGSVDTTNLDDYIAELNAGGYGYCAGWTGQVVTE